jgi:hypothetical protein
MIITDKNNFVIGFGSNIERVFEGEDLIKITKENGMFHYITYDDEFTILNLHTPDSSKYWNYIDGEFIEATENQ